MPFSNPIVGGTTLIRPAIHSPDYVAGSSGWSINKDGSAEFNDVTIRGDGNGDALIVGPDDGPQVEIGSTPTFGYVEFPTNRPVENTPAHILSNVLNSGAANEAASLQIHGPTVDGATDIGRIFVTSQNNDGSSQASVSLTAGSGDVATDAAVIFNKQSLVVSRLASGLSAIFLTTGAGHTGNMMRLTLNGADRFVVNNAGNGTFAGDVASVDATFTGVLTAANRITGTTTITPSAANTPTSRVITFPTPLTGSTFTCQVTAETTVPGTFVTGVSYTALSATGVTLWLTRANTTATNISYTVEGF